MFRVIKTRERGSGKDRILGAAGREGLKTTEGRSWTLSLPAPPSPCRSSWGAGEAQGLAQGHLLLIYPLLGWEGTGEGTGPGRFAFTLEKSVSQWLWGYGREWKMFSFLDPRPS